jgi:hypothetical protein
MKLNNLQILLLSKKMCDHHGKWRAAIQPRPHGATQPIKLALWLNNVISSLNAH